MLLSNALSEYLSIRATRLSPVTLAQYESELDRFLASCTAANVTDTSQLSAAVVAGYLNTLRTQPTCHGKSRASHTLAHYARGLRVFVHWLVEEELAPARCLRWEMPKAEQLVPPTMTPAQEKQLLAACGESRGPAMQARDTAIVLLLLETGCRVSELCGLKLEHVKLDNDDAHVLLMGKGSKWREVGPLGRRTVRALRAYVHTWREKQHPQGDTFFVNREGRPMNRHTVEQMLERLKARTGLDVECHPHSFRHSWARTRAVQGVTTVTIQRLMGHSNLATTSVYLQTFQSADARKQVKSLVDGL